MPAFCALRMRVSRSPSGSVIAMSHGPPLPTRLDHARDLAGRCKLSQRDARQLELAVDAARAAGQLTAIVLAHRRGVARQLGELEARRKALLHGQSFVIRGRLEPRPSRRILLRHADALVVAFDGTRLGHSRPPATGQLTNGRSKPFSRALASASVF